MLYKFLLLFIKIELFYSVIPISAVQHSDLGVCVCVCVCIHIHIFVYSLTYTIYFDFCTSYSQSPQEPAMEAILMCPFV